MKTTKAIVLAMTMLTAGVSASAQSVSQLSSKPSAETRTILQLAEKLAKATPAERQELESALSALMKIKESGTTGVNLAIPAGATASVGEDGEPAGGARIGFQTWKSDDFFAGAFFTFDAAPALNGDLRKAGQFLRDPPNAGTSLFVTGNRMFKAYRCGKITPVRWDTDEVPDNPCETSRGDKRDAVIIGLSFRAGATSTTLQHKLSTAAAGEGEDAPEPEVESREASILHATLSLLLTSRTFRSDDGGEYQFGLELGGTARRIGGDAAYDSDFLAQPDVFGHASTSFIGFDATFFARMNGFQPFVRITHIPKRDGKHVPGLTGVQASFGINVSSSLFQTTKEARKGDDQ